MPISEKSIPPVLRRKAEETDDHKPSKLQIKKEKRTVKKTKKQKSRSYNDNIMNTSLSRDSLSEDKKSNDNSDSESDADVEDNIEENFLHNSSSQNKNEHRKGTESGYNSDKADNGSPDLNNRGDSPDMRVDDSGVPSPAVQMLSVSSPILNNVDNNSPSSSEVNIEMSPICGHNSPVEE